jgi:regulator of nucleoside diphosphate kinase
MGSILDVKLVMKWFCRTPKNRKGATMKNKGIQITDYDLDRLRKLLRTSKLAGKSDDAFLKLEKELERAEVVSSRKIPADVVTMNSIARIKDLDTNEEMILQLVLPDDSNLNEGKISILAPVGTAILGYRVGDAVDWQVPAGIRRLRIKEILYQPEAAGDFFL